jgi:anti-sigma B factor antagonist
MSAGPTILAPTGDLDIATARGFRSELFSAAEATDGDVVVDLSGVDFIDSTGLGAVIEAHERLRALQRSVAVVAPPGSSAALILNLSGLNEGLAIYASREHALAASAG